MVAVARPGPRERSGLHQGSCDVGPSRRRSKPSDGRASTLLWPEQIQIGDDSLHRLEYVVAVINEVRDADFSAMKCFLRTAQAKAKVRLIDAGSLEEAMVLEPSPRLFLDPRPAFRDDPHAPLELLNQAGNDFEHPDVRRRPQGVFERAPYKRRVRR